MIKLGIIGFSAGNGHPFSYAAIFNGYDPIELEARCPFPLIKEYLPLEHRNEIFIEHAKVTHVWTQDPLLSIDIAKVSQIPHVVKNYQDMVGEVDGIILARDDPWNHFEIAQFFIKARLPLFIDKQIVADQATLHTFLQQVDEGYPLMAGSAMRFTRDLAQAKKQINIEKIRSIHGMSRASWMRYGHHLLEGVTELLGLEVQAVQSLSDQQDHDIVQITFASGVNVILEFIEHVQLPIQFTCFSETHSAYCVPFKDFFYGFRAMLLKFVEMIMQGKKSISFTEIITIAKIILAGDLSKKMQGIKICPRTMKPLSANKTLYASLKS